MSISRTVAVALTIACPTTAFAGASVSGVYLGYGANEQWGCAYKSSLVWDSTASVNYANLKLSERLWDLGDGSTTVTWCAQVYQGVTVGNSYTFDVVAMDMVPQTPPAPGPMGFAKAAVMSDVMSRWLGADSRVIALWTGAISRKGICEEHRRSRRWSEFEDLLRTREVGALT